MLNIVYNKFTEYFIKGYNNISGDGVITITAYAINEEVGA